MTTDYCDITSPYYTFITGGIAAIACINIGTRYLDYVVLEVDFDFFSPPPAMGDTTYNRFHDAKFHCRYRDWHGTHKLCGLNPFYEILAHA